MLGPCRTRRGRWGPDYATAIAIPLGDLTTLVTSNSILTQAYPVERPVNLFLLAAGLLLGMLRRTVLCQGASWTLTEGVRSGKTPPLMICCISHIYFT